MGSETWLGLHRRAMREFTWDDRTSVVFTPWGPLDPREDQFCAFLNTNQSVLDVRQSCF